MKSCPLITCFIAAFSLFAPVLRAAPEIATQFDFSSETTPGARKFNFTTTPGHRYMLWRSMNLTDWAPVPGYPKTATGLAIEHIFSQSAKEFFRIEPIDD